MNNLFEWYLTWDDGWRGQVARGAVALAMLSLVLFGAGGLLGMVIGAFLDQLAGTPAAHPRGGAIGSAIGVLLAFIIVGGLFVVARCGDHQKDPSVR